MEFYSKIFFFCFLFSCATIEYSKDPLDLIKEKRKEGDYPPHTATFVNLNGDKNPDIFFLEGEEDLFASGVYLSTEKNPLKRVGDLASPYHFIGASYSYLLDINQDGKAEILEIPKDNLKCMKNVVIPKEIKRRIKNFWKKFGEKYSSSLFNKSVAEPFSVSKEVRIVSCKSRNCLTDRKLTREYKKWQLSTLKLFYTLKESWEYTFGIDILLNEDKRAEKEKLCQSELYKEIKALDRQIKSKL